MEGQGAVRIVEKILRDAEVQHLECLLAEGLVVGLAHQAVVEFLDDGGLEFLLDDVLGSLAGPEAGDAGLRGVAGDDLRALGVHGGRRDLDAESGDAVRLLFNGDVHDERSAREKAGNAPGAGN